MKSVLLYLILFLGAFLAVPKWGSAQNAEVPPPITLYRESVNLREALRLISPDGFDHYVVKDEVPDVAVTLNLERLSMPQSGRLILAQAALLLPGLAHSRDGGPYLVAQRKNKKDPIAEDVLTYGRVRRDAVTIWSWLFNGTKVKTELPAEAQKSVIEINVEKLPRREAVNQVVRQLSTKISNLSVNSIEWQVRKMEPQPATKVVEK
jgi:hypothetical protein